MAGVLTSRMLIAVSATSHHRQWSITSFKISGEQGRFCSSPLKIGIAK
jgi:hypothetical protein